MVRGAEARNVWREGCVRGIRIGVLWPQGRANAQKKNGEISQAAGRKTNRSGGGRRQARQPGRGGGWGRSSYRKAESGGWRREAIVVFCGGRWSAPSLGFVCYLPRFPCCLLEWSGKARGVSDRLTAGPRVMAAGHERGVEKPRPQPRARARVRPTTAEENSSWSTGICQQIQHFVPAVPQCCICITAERAHCTSKILRVFQRYHIVQIIY
jgi:hypothetical protein